MNKMKVLNAHEWSQKEENKKKFPNGSVVSEIMTAYAKYYHTTMILAILKGKKPNDN